MIDDRDRQAYAHLAPAYQRIVTRMIPVDPEGDYAQLEKKLRLRETAPHRAEGSAIVDALDEAQDNAWTAHKLHLGARIAQEIAKVGIAARLAPIRNAANAALQREKTAGIRSKNITDSDVEAMMAAMFPDEWMAILVEQAKVEEIAEKMKELAKLWGTRAQTLQAELHTARSRGSFSLVD